VIGRAAIVYGAGCGEYWGHVVYCLSIFPPASIFGFSAW